MTRRCAGCGCTLASDHDDEMCSPCTRSLDDAVASLARWLVRYTGRGSEVSAALFAESLIRLLSCGGVDGERIRQRMLQADAGPRRTTSGRITRRRPRGVE